MPVICDRKGCDSPAVLKRPKSGHALCKECFFFAFELEIHITIENTKLFKRGDRVAIGASGGKDSTVLAYIMKLLNERYDYGLDLFLLSIDEGIAGYRDDSLETVKQNRDDYQLPLKILSYKDLYGWTMDEIVQQIGDKNNCTFCGTFRRQALDRGAALVGANMIVTGHNADDMAETVIMNILRGDIARLSRCTNIITQGEGTIPRCKPLKYVYEKEIVMYAHFKKLVYFSTECKYAPNAYRGYAREYIKQIERVRPSCLIDIIYSGENLELNESVKLPERQTCTRCGFVASQEICKACVLLEGLNTGNPKLGIGKSNKAKRALGLKINDGSENKPKSRPEKGISKKKIRREEKRKKTGCGGGGCSSSCGSEQIPDSELKIDMEKEAFLERNCPGGCKLRTITLEKELLDHLPQSTRAQLNSIKKNFNAEVNSAAIRDCKTSDGEQTESSCEEDKLSLLSRIASNMEPAWYCTCKNGESSSSRKQYTRKKNSVAINKLQKPELFIPTSKSQTENACSLSNDHSVPSTSAEEEKIFDNDTKNEENITCRCPEILRIHPNHPEVKVPYNKSERLYDIEDGEDFDIHVFKSIMIAKHPEIVDELKKLEEEQLKNNVCTEEPSSSIAVIKQNQTKTDLKDDEKISQLSSKLKTSINLESQNQSDNDNTNKIEEQLTNTEINDTNGPQLPKSLKNIEQSSDNQPTIIKATPKRKEPSLIRPEMMHKAKNNLDF